MKRMALLVALCSLLASGGAMSYGDPTASGKKGITGDLVAIQHHARSSNKDVVVRDSRKSESRNARHRYDSMPIGNYNNGCLMNGIQLNADSPYFQLYHPQNQRHFADLSMVRFLDRYSKKVHAAGIESVLVGDVSTRFGGPFNTGHASHQIGLDVDIEFSHRRLPQSRLSTSGNAQMLVDHGAQTVNSNFNRKYYDMLMIAAQDPDVERIFVNPAIKVAMCDMTKDERLQPYLRKIRPWFGHSAHFHVRLKCPAGAAQCVRQERPKTLYTIAQEKEEALSWFEPAPKPESSQTAANKPKPKPKASFPESCTLYYQSMNMKVPSAKKRR